MRQQVQDKEAEYEEKKHAYDTLSLQLESSMSRVEQEVKKFQEEILANETKHQLMELRNRNLELMLQRAHDEIKLYVSQKAEDKKKSVREQLLKQVNNLCKEFSFSCLFSRKEIVLAQKSFRINLIQLEKIQLMHEHTIVCIVHTRNVIKSKAIFPIEL